jgi:hypothetical protein
MDSDNNTPKKPKELPLFIGEDGKLTVFYNNLECEVIGARTTIFCDSWMGTVK